MLRTVKSEITSTRATLGIAYGNDWELYSAQQAIDRDLSTAAATQTDNGADWFRLELELDRTYFIHEIVIYYRFHSNWYFPKDECFTQFKSCVDSDNNVDVSVYQGEVKQTSCGTLQLTYALEQSDQIYKLTCNVQGDIVKLSKATGRITVFEIVVTRRHIDITGIIIYT